MTDTLQLGQQDHAFTDGLPEGRDARALGDADGVSRQLTVDNVRMAVELGRLSGRTVDAVEQWRIGVAIARVVLGEER